MIKRIALLAACMLACAGAASTANAEWPDRPIRFIVGFGPGGANDLIARFAAEGVGKNLKQTVVVENRPGAGAVIGTAYVAHSAPDGYTFLVGAANTITNSLLLKDLPYKDEDLVPVGMIAVAPSTIIVNPSVPASNMKEFIAWAKAQNGKARNRIPANRFLCPKVPGTPYMASREYPWADAPTTWTHPMAPAARAKAIRHFDSIRRAQVGLASAIRRAVWKRRQIRRTSLAVSNMASGRSAARRTTAARPRSRSWMTAWSSFRSPRSD